MTIINKYKDNIVTTVFVYTLPLLCLVLPFGIYKWIVMIVLQAVMVYVCMRLFDNCNETKRRQSLHTQAVISIVGCFVAYQIGIRMNLTEVQNVWMLYVSMLAYSKTLRGICAMLLYLVIDSILCGSGIMLSIGIELAKENEYIK